MSTANDFTALVEAFERAATLNGEYNNSSELAETKAALFAYVSKLKRTLSDTVHDVERLKQKLVIANECHEHALTTIKKLKHVTEEQVELACESYYGQFTWMDMHSTSKETCRKNMRYALDEYRREK